MTVSTTGDAGGCSLRQAIVAVNEDNNGTSCGPVVSSGTTPITLPAGHYTLTAGELQIGAGANLAITGANPSNPAETKIDAGGASRVLEVAAGGQATLAGVEVTGGQTANGTNGVEPLHSGGVGGNGGGILNHGTLTLDHALVTVNKTGHGGKGADGNASATAARNPASGGEGGSGGGIYNDHGASLTVIASTISDNVTGDGGAGGNAAMGVQGLGNIPSGADGGNGAYSGSGGGIYNAGTLTIATTTVSGNSTGRGGAGGSGGQGAGESEHSPAGEGGEGGSGGNGGLLYGENGFPQYAAFFGGGGIYNGGTLAMTASTLSGNNTGAGGNGGGAGIGGERENGTFEDARHGGDAGSGGLGGGLLNLGTGATLTNVTVAGNRTGDGGTGGATAQSGSLGGGLGGFGGYGGGIWARGTNTSDIVQLTDVTIAGNFVGALGVGGAERISGERGLGAGIATGPQFTGSGNSVILKNTLVASNGLPMSGDQNCVQKIAGDIHDGGHDISFPDASCPGANGDPLLGALGENGGPTKTLLPGAGGSAIGAVPLASCTVSEDQRGLPRPAAGKSSCDIGAVETSFAGESTPPGGGGGGGTETPPAFVPPPPTTQPPAPKPLQCKKGFVKKAVKGKPTCVKAKHKRKKHKH